MHGTNDGAEVVIKQDNIASIARYLRSRAHRDANIGIGQRGDIIDAVACHGGDVCCIECCEDAMLVLWYDPREDARPGHHSSQLTVA